jgi:hypothetical protein
MMRRKRIKDLALQNQAKSGRIRNKTTTKIIDGTFERNWQEEDLRLIRRHAQTISRDTDPRMAGHRSIQADRAK